MPNDIFYRYFVFSKTQRDEKIRREEKLGREAEFGKVIVNGVPKQFTAILQNMEQAIYPDTIKITEGDIRKITYTKR